jgi:hypothetical protein
MATQVTHLIIYAARYSVKILRTIVAAGIGRLRSLAGQEPLNAGNDLSLNKN